MFSIEIISVVLQFAIATALPVLASVALTQLFRQERFAHMKYWHRQVFCGLVFGIIAIFGTEFGIETHDATMNVRDAAPIVAGLYFGGPAGIIAGIIGGVERWFAALWGRGVFTRVACSVATIAVGFYAALLNRFLFDERKPSWPLAFAIGMVAEVLHLLLVFVTNMDDIARAFLVVQACSFPMILCNGLSTALSGAAIAFLQGQRLHHKSETRGISQVIQLGMLGVVIIGFVVTVGFTFLLQQSTSRADVRNTLALELSDVKNDVQDASDENLLKLARVAAETVPSVMAAQNVNLATLARSLYASEIHVIDAQGIIVASSDPSYLGFDMHSGEQSSEFLDLLPNGRSSYHVQSYQPTTIDSSQWRKFAGIRISGGFIQISYDGEQFVDDIASQVDSSVANRHVGWSGMFVVIEESGKLTGTRFDVSVTSSEVQALFEAAKAHEESTVYEVSFHEMDYYAMRQDVEGFIIIAMLPIVEATSARDLAVLVTSFMEVIVFAALFIAIYVLIKNVVVHSIWEVNGTLDKITSGDLKAEVNVRDSTEFSSLSDDINKTVAALRAAIAAESSRIERDLATAKAIQSSALPRTFPPFPDIDAFNIYASMNAAREVGGDFYDFFLIDSHTLGFLIADVSGKGIPAALFMMAAKSELANYMKSGMDLAEAVHSANINLCRGNDAGMFVTVWAASLDFETGVLTYVNAGHNPPLLRHDGTWEWLTKKSGLFLGTFETARYHAHSIPLFRGDELILYTDGVNEAFSANEEEYGNERLEAFLVRNNVLHPHQLIDLLRADLRKWAEGTEQSDDITMLCVEYGVPPEVSKAFTVPATRMGLDELILSMRYELASLQCPTSIQSHIELTIEELFTNICTHGYQDTKEENQIELVYAYNAHPSGIVVSITDWGIPFDPLSYQRGEGGDEVTGMGVALALGSVDDIAYIRDGDRNVIAFRKDWE